MNTREIEKILIDFFQRMGIRVGSKIEETQDALRINVKPKEENLTSLLIGYRGESLAAIEYLLRIILRRKTGKLAKIILDINDYRYQQIESLKKVALTLAQRVKKTQRVEVLRPMTAYERREIHLAIKEIDGLITQSVGDEPNRRIIIKPKE